MLPLGWYSALTLTMPCISLLEHAGLSSHLQVFRQTVLTGLCQHC